MHLSCKRALNGGIERLERALLSPFSTLDDDGEQRQPNTDRQQSPNEQDLPGRRVRMTHWGKKPMARPPDQ